MTDRPFGIGLIGLGAVAQAHLRAYDLLSNVDIVSVCDVDRASVRRVADLHHADGFTDHRELLARGGVDMVLVLTPASTHRAIVEDVAKAGYHVFCEKPLAVTLQDAEAIVAACRRAGVKLFYGSSYRYLPAVMEARARIQAGEIGAVQLLTEQVIGGRGLENYRQLPTVHYPPGGPGGPGMGIIDHGIHLIDVFPWLIDSEIVDVHGRGQVSGAAAGCEYMMMHFANGALGHLLYNAATYSAGLPYEGRFSEGQGWQADGSITEVGNWEADPGSISVYGSKGALRIFHYSNGLYLNRGAGARRIALNGRAAFGHFATQLEACAAAIFDDRAPPVDGGAGLRALRAMLKVYEARKC